MRRVLVVGVTGAGKSTAAQRLATRMNLAYHEMDALAIGPDWVTPPDFVASVEQIVKGPSWVFDSHGYEPVIDAMWAAADTIVWLDYPARIVIPRVLRRSIARSVSRVELFGGIRETWRGWLSRDHPVWWSIATLRSRRAYLADRTQSVSARHLRIVRLTSPREFEGWLGLLLPASTESPGSP